MEVNTILTKYDVFLTQDYEELLLIASFYDERPLSRFIKREEDYLRTNEIFDHLEIVVHEYSNNKLVNTYFVEEGKLVNKYEYDFYRTMERNYRL